MAGIGVLLPDVDTYNKTKNLIDENTYDVKYIKVIDSKNILDEATDALEKGINIIIAYGEQANLINKYLDIKLVNITITAQELGLLILKAKELLKKDNITIGLFSFEKMFCDTIHFNKLYNIDLRVINFESIEDWQKNIETVDTSDFDIIIGSNLACEYADKLNIPNILATSTDESLKIALDNAQSVYDVFESEKKTYTQFTTALDYSGNYIIKINSNFEITYINQKMKDIFNKNTDYINQKINYLIEEINLKNIDELFQGKQDNYSTFVQINGVDLVLTGEAITIDNKIIEVLLCFSNINNTHNSSKSSSNSSAYISFKTLITQLKGLQPVIEQAKLFAISQNPILIESLPCPELEMLTQSIHNFSSRKNSPYIVINIGGLDEDKQNTALFSTEKENLGAFMRADQGTLVIQGIDKLSRPNQYKLTRTIQTKRLNADQDNNEVFVNARIIGCTSKNLTDLRNKFMFRSDLYYTLNSLRLKIPTLNKRPEDVEYFLTTYFKTYLKEYSRYHTIPLLSKRILLDYPWELTYQIKSFCERMILSATHKELTPEYILNLLNDLYKTDFGVDYIDETKEHNVISNDPYEELLINTLKKYKGSRKLVADELNISTTTLWRRMKKYNLLDFE